MLDREITDVEDDLDTAIGRGVLAMWVLIHRDIYKHCERIVAPLIMMRATSAAHQ